MPERPTTATILFTDLVGSTELRIQLGEDSADELRQVHDRMLRDAVESHGGTVVKGGGDGVMAAFSSASDALAAAVEGQQALHLYSTTGAALARLEVRMGLSIGDVSWDDGDCFGTPVVEAARLEAEAGGGEILCTDFVRAMARGRGGHELTDLGLRELKGLPQPLGVCRVEWEPRQQAPGRDERLPLPSVVGANAAGPIAGRESDLQAISAHLAAPGFRLVLLAGEAGIGKTRLACEAAGQRYDEGAVVLFGRCDEDIVMPFQPVIEALAEVVMGSSADRLRHLLGGAASELSRLYPDLANLVPGVSPPAEIRDGADAYRLFEAVRSWLTQHSQDDLVLVVDDIQWASPVTLQLLRHLMRHPEPPPISVIATARDTTDPDVDVARLLDEITASSTVLSLELRGLDDAAIARLTGADATAVRQIGEETGGNALFVTSIVASGSGGGALPVDLRSAVRRRLAEVSDRERSVLEMCAIAGHEFPLRPVASALEMGRGDLAEVLDRASHRALIQDVETRAGRFSHGLVRKGILEDLGAGQRALLHERYARALESLPQPDPVSLAHHWRAALPVVDNVDHVADIVGRAGMAAFESAAFEEALDLMLAGAELVGERAEALPLLVAAGDGARFLGRLALAVEIAERAYRLATELDQLDWMRRAAIVHGCATTYSAQFGAEASLGMTEPLVALPTPDTALLAELLGVHSFVLGQLGRNADSKRYAARAIELSEQIDNPRVLHLAATSLRFSFESPTDVHPFLAELERLEPRLGEGAGAIANAMHTLHLGSGQLLANRIRPAEYYLEAVESLRAKTVEQYIVYDLLNNASRAALLRGDFESAERIAHEAHDEGDGMEGMDPSGSFGVQMFSIRREQGRLEEVGAVLATALRRPRHVWLPGLVALYAEMGEATRCAEVLDRILESGYPLPDDDRKGLSLAYLADGACLVAHPLVPALAEDLEPYRGMNLATYGTACAGPADRYLGLLARATGDLDRSVCDLEIAVAMTVAGPTPVYEARARHDLAMSLLERNAAGDRAAASAQLTSAASISSQLGMAGLARSIGAARELHDV